MIRITRLTPYCQIALPLVMLAVALNLVLSALAATPLLGWLPRKVTGTGFLEDSRTRVVQVVREYQQQRIGRRDYLGAFVGISNLREAIELSVIGEAAGPGWRFLGVAGAGFGMGDVRQYADLILATDLRPDVVFLGLGLHQIVDFRPVPRSAQPGLVGYLRRGELRNAAITVRNATWIYERRQDISLAAEATVLDLRARLFAGFGVPLPQTEANRRSPWREMVRADWPDHFSAATLRAQEQMFTNVGVFEKETYEQSPRAMSTLLSTIEQFQSRGAKVVLLLMPEHSTLHQRIPPEAFSRLQQRLQARFPRQTPLIQDFRTAVDDSGFVDLPHLNRRGRLQFSRKLAGAMRELLPQGGRLARQSEAANADDVGSR